MDVAARLDGEVRHIAGGMVALGAYASFDAVLSNLISWYPPCTTFEEVVQSILAANGGVELQPPPQQRNYNQQHPQQHPQQHSHPQQHDNHRQRHAPPLGPPAPLGAYKAPPMAVTTPYLTPLDVPALAHLYHVERRLHTFVTAFMGCRDLACLADLEAEAIRMLRGSCVPPFAFAPPPASDAPVVASADPEEIDLEIDLESDAEDEGGGAVAGAGGAASGEAGGTLSSEANGGQLGGGEEVSASRFGSFGLGPFAQHSTVALHFPPPSPRPAADPAAVGSTMAEGGGGLGCGGLTEEEVLEHLLEYMQTERARVRISSGEGGGSGGGGGYGGTRRGGVADVDIVDLMRYMAEEEDEIEHPNELRVRVRGDHNGRGLARECLMLRQVVQAREELHARKLDQVG